MKANDFFKKHGLAEVKILLTSPSHGFFFKEDFYKHYGFDIYEDLKRIVESHRLIEVEGGIDQVKDTFSFAYKHGADELTEYGKRLKQAIADVESCQ